MNKKVYAFLGVMVVVVGLVLVLSSKKDSSLPEATVSDASNEVVNVVEDTGVRDTGAESLTTEIAWKGFGPGKVHNGSFSNLDSELALSDGKIQGEILVDMSSLTSDTEKLTEHLKSADFFDVENFGEAKFVFTDMSSSEFTGQLTVHGVTKLVTAPYTESAGVYTSTFNIDMSDFGIEQAFANEEIELTITIK